MDFEKEKKIREVLSIMEVTDGKNKEKYQQMRKILDFQKTVNREEFKNDLLLYYTLKKINSQPKMERVLQKAISPSEREIIENLMKKSKN